jgi:hypothetical protein
VTSGDSYTIYIPKSTAASKVHFEFSQLSDLIWKLPRFLDNEIQIEQEKLESYFPAADLAAANYRAIRVELEGAKLYREFPRYLHQTGVLLAVALYEARLVHYVNGALKPGHVATTIKECRKLLSERGMDVEKIRFSRQVDIAFLVRHSIIHLSGYVDQLRDRDKLAAAIEQKLYLEEWQLDRSIDSETPWLSIEQDAFGNRLCISHEYSFGIGPRLRDNVCEIIDLLPQ